MKKQPSKNNNIETRKDIEEETKRILLAEERDDPEQVIINITPDILQQLQEEYDEMKEAGYRGSYQDYLYSKRYYTSSTPYHMFGFNALEPKQDWDGRLVKESFDGDNKSWLICFSGKPIINGVIVKPLDYAKLDNKHYEVILNDAIVGVFTKL